MGSDSVDILIYRKLWIFPENDIKCFSFEHPHHKLTTDMLSAKKMFAEVTIHVNFNGILKDIDFV